MNSGLKHYSSKLDQRRGY